MKINVKEKKGAGGEIKFTKAGNYLLSESVVNFVRGTIK